MPYVLFEFLLLPMLLRLPDFVRDRRIQSPELVLVLTSRPVFYAPVWTSDVPGWNRRLYQQTWAAQVPQPGFRIHLLTRLSWNYRNRNGTHGRVLPLLRHASHSP